MRASFAAVSRVGVEPSSGISFNGANGDLLTAAAGELWATGDL